MFGGLLDSRLSSFNTISSVSDYLVNRPDSKAIPEPNIRAAVETFLGLGETVFDTVQATAVSSSYFKRDPKGSRTWCVR